MGNCECYDVEKQLPSNNQEFGFKDQLSIETAANDFSNSFLAVSLPKIEPPASAVKYSTIRVDAASAAERTAPPQLGELVQKTMQELPELQYDDVQRGQYFKCQRFFDTDNIYEGETILNGTVALPHGRGNLYYTDGSFFTGTFVNGKAQGKGRLISGNGSYYEGAILNNKMEGSGKYRDSKGTYEGMMLSGVPHGQGIFRTDQLEFNGKFEKGQKVYGTLIWGDARQCSYLGQIKNDMFNGEGKLHSPAGTYEGKFVDGLKQGFGVFTWSDGKKFEGNYKQDKKCGYGEYYESDGTPIYKGSWQADKPRGMGIEFKKNSQTKKLTLLRVECNPSLQLQ